MRAVLPEQDIRLRYNTCAIVGNSGTMKHRGLGPQIDQHEAVIRINYAPTKGFERDVGQKVTFDLVNKENAMKLSKNIHKWRCVCSQLWTMHVEHTGALFGKLCVFVLYTLDFFHLCFLSTTICKRVRTSVV